MSYPRLPELPPVGADETIAEYGIRVLAFVLATDVTATLTDRDLDLADHAYAIAISSAGILPIAVDRLSAARMRILRTLQARQRAQPAPARVSPQPAPIVSRPGGRLTPLQPAPISRPPAGQLVDLRF